MNKSELVKSISEKSNLTQKDADAALKGFIDTVVEALAKGDKVSLVGFGTFESKTRAARIGRNPRTKEEINIPETTVPAFKPGSDFKKSISK